MGILHKGPCYFGVRIGAADLLELPHGFLHVYMICLAVYLYILHTQIDKYSVYV